MTTIGQAALNRFQHAVLGACVIGMFFCWSKATFQLCDPGILLVQAARSVSGVFAGFELPRTGVSRIDFLQTLLRPMAPTYSVSTIGRLAPFGLLWKVSLQTTDADGCAVIRTEKTPNAWIPPAESVLLGQIPFGELATQTLPQIVQSGALVQCQRTASWLTPRWGGAPYLFRVPYGR